MKDVSTRQAKGQGTQADWQPSASIESLRQRATMLQQIRNFFAARSVLEVTTPVLASHSVTDIHIESLEVISSGSDARRQGYLQTSPEYMMKRLLAADSGPIYQINPAFRQEETGRLHQVEFTMLEWYRPGWEAAQLRAEVDSLMQQVAQTQPALQCSYAQLFQKYLGINPHQATLASMYEIATQHSLENFAELVSGDRDTALQLLMSSIIEPALKQDLASDTPIFIYDFPATQAALAQLKTVKLNKQNIQVADRFELYWQGVELANGFFELCDVNEQRLRFQQQQTLRYRRGQVVPDIDEQFLAALEHGLPPCSGVALGIDRLCMLCQNKNNLPEVMAFSNSTLA